MKNNYYLAIFRTKNKAIMLYSMLEDAGYKNFTLVTSPCIIKTGCNYAIKFKDKTHISTISLESDRLGIESPQIYLADSSRGGFKYIKIDVN